LGGACLIKKTSGVKTLVKTVKKSMVKIMNQSISRFLGQLAKRFGEEEVHEVILQKPEQSVIEPKQAVTLQRQELGVG
jgi:hypothetical protein